MQSRILAGVSALMGFSAPLDEMSICAYLCAYALNVKRAPRIFLMTINVLPDGQAFSHDEEMPERALRQFEPRTRHLIEAPITPTLLRLAAPNVLVMVVQASVGLIETYFVGKLGTDALAGVALVFPALMLMQMMSAGAMGGGISSAIARALGAGRRADADALVLHAMVIALAFGFAFTAALLPGGPRL